MKTNFLHAYPIFVFTALLFLASCDTDSKKPKETPLVIQEDSITEVNRAQETRASISPKIAEVSN